MKKPNWKKFGKWLRRKALPFLFRNFSPIADCLYAEASRAILDIAATMMTSPGRDKRECAEKIIRERLASKGIEASASAINLAIEEAYNSYKEKAINAAADERVRVAEISMDFDYGAYTNGKIKREYAEENVFYKMDSQGIKVSKSEVNLAVERALKYLK